MLMFEYDREAELRAVKQDGLLEGKREGMREGILEGQLLGKRTLILSMINKGKSIDEISDFIGIPKIELQQLIN